MMEFSFFETFFHDIFNIISLLLQVICVLMITIGAAEATYRTIWPWIMRRTTLGSRRDAWQSFGRWLLLGLEFMLAADIVETAVAPDWKDIGHLAAIAIIRTFLSYFLEKDLKEIANSEHKTTNKKKV